MSSISICEEESDQMLQLTNHRRAPRVIRVSHHISIILHHRFNLFQLLLLGGCEAKVWCETAKMITLEITSAHTLKTLHCNDKFDLVLLVVPLIFLEFRHGFARWIAIDDPKKRANFPHVYFKKGETSERRGLGVKSGDLGTRFLSAKAQTF